MSNDIVNILTALAHFPPECGECVAFYAEAIRSVPCNGDWYKGCKNRTDYKEEDEEEDNEQK